MSKPPIKLQRQ